MTLLLMFQEYGVMLILDLLFGIWFSVGEHRKDYFPYYMLSSKTIVIRDKSFNKI